MDGFFQVRSKSPKLTVYKKECYEILFNHFNGAITRRQKVLHSKNNLQSEIKSIKKRLTNNEEYQKLLTMEKLYSVYTKELKSLDSELVDPQLKMNIPPSNN